MSLRKEEVIIGKVESSIHGVKEIEFVVTEFESFHCVDIRIRTQESDMKLRDALVIKCFHNGSGFHVIKDRWDVNNLVERKLIVKP